VSICSAATPMSSTAGQARQSFHNLKSKFMGMGSLLKPLLPPPIVTLNLASGSDQQHSSSHGGQPVPQTTRGTLQLPISPFGGQPADYSQVSRPGNLTLAPMTPQMGGNIAFQRRHPVRAQPDETVCDDRYGICIRKTQYREDQQDRVSTSFTH